MFFYMRNKIKYLAGLFIAIILFIAQPVYAAGPPAPSIFNNGTALALIGIMILLLIVIGVLGTILIGAADFKSSRNKKGVAEKIIAFIGMTFISSSLFSQDVTVKSTSLKESSIGGLDTTTFYIMIGIIALELLIILGMLLNLQRLLKRKKEQAVVLSEKTVVAKENKLGWWGRLNKLKPQSEEADIDLGHDYDGIRELDNRLPPWWLYGFYISIIFAVVYLWRFHVSHTGPSSQEEYETSVAKAKAKTDAYLLKKGEAIDENTVTLLTKPDEIAAGKAIFTDPTKCVACHNADGGGNAIGPNLTDDYWLYGGSIKDIFKTVKYGTSKGMRAWKDDLSAKQIAEVSSYIKTVLHGSKPKDGKAPQGELYKEDAPAATAPADTAKGVK